MNRNVCLFEYKGKYWHPIQTIFVWKSLKLEIIWWAKPNLFPAAFWSSGPGRAEQQSMPIERQREGATEWQDGANGDINNRFVKHFKLRKQLSETTARQLLFLLHRRTLPIHQSHHLPAPAHSECPIYSCHAKHSLIDCQLFGWLCSVHLRFPALLHRVNAII